MSLLLAVMLFARALKYVALFGFTDVADDILSIIYFRQNVLDCLVCISYSPLLQQWALAESGQLSVAPVFFVGVSLQWRRTM